MWLVLTYLLLLRVSELHPETMCGAYCFKRSSIEQKLEGEGNPGVKYMDIMFIVDQEQRGA